MPDERHFLHPYLTDPAGAWGLRNASNGRLLASSIVPAFDRQTRNQGLLGRSNLPPGVAMVLAPCSGIHTWFMRFPIDVIFAARTGRVLRVCRTVRPFRLAIRLGAFAVIELAAESSTEISVDDSLVLALVTESDGLVCLQQPERLVPTRQRSSER